MKQMSSAQVRQMWLDFWATKGHAVEPSVSLVPVNDPTLLWIVGHVELVFGKIKPLRASQKLVSPLNRFIAEIIADREIA